MYIYQVTFTTSKGRRLGPFGRDGKDETVSVDIPRERELIPHQDGVGDFKCLALHGFTFCINEDFGDEGVQFWENIQFVYSCVRADLGHVKGLKI
ncbi:unnamed protein product [Hymenolepis diminuta]|nr:unnamed protein product [Hymenolepis diminuta]